MSYYPPTTIASAIQKIDYKQYLLPAIQREFVWSAEEIELLFDSLMREYPIGSLLMWKVEGENKTNHRYYEILKKYRERYLTQCIEINTNDIHDFEAVLDGQQRLTALYLGLKGSYAYKIPRLAWNNNEYSLPTRKLYLNLSQYANENELEQEDEYDDGRLFEFVFWAQEDFEEDEKFIWFEVGKILSLQGTFKLNNYIKEQGWENNQFASETLSKLHDIIHVKPLINYYLESEQNYDKALNIFIRTNSGGQKLEYSDLIMSTTIAGWKKKKAREEFTSLINEILDETGIEINKDLILRTYLLLYSTDIKFRATNFSMKNAKEFEDNWDTIRAAIKETFILIKDFGYVEHTMTSKNAALPIIYYLHKSNRTKDFTKKIIYKQDRENIKRWLHAVLLYKIFGGQAENVLKTIRDTISTAIDNITESFPSNAIAKKLSKTRKSITVDDEFIENLLYTQYGDRYAFPILALLYPYLDYRNGDFHKDHVFPITAFNQKNLKKSGINTEGERGDYYTGWNIFNGILNLQLLDGNENKSKQDKTYAEWAQKENLDFKKAPFVINN